MNDLERAQMLKVIKDYTEKLKADKEASKAFLYEIGMLTKTGKLKKEYKRITSDKEVHWEWWWSIGEYNSPSIRFDDFDKMKSYSAIHSKFFHQENYTSNYIKIE